MRWKHQIYIQIYFVPIFHIISFVAFDIIIEFSEILENYAISRFFFVSKLRDYVELKNGPYPPSKSDSLHKPCREN